MRFTPRKTCEMFWAACICGVWLAFTTPRQTIPLLKPSDSGVGFMSCATKRSYGMLVASALYSQPVICLRPPSM